MNDPRRVLRRIQADALTDRILLAALELSLLENFVPLSTRTMRGAQAPSEIGQREINALAHTMETWRKCADALAGGRVDQDRAHKEAILIKDLRDRIDDHWRAFEASHPHYLKIEIAPRPL